jgi:hypothetical protein
LFPDKLIRDHAGRHHFGALKCLEAVLNWQHSIDEKSPKDETYFYFLGFYFIRSCYKSMNN